MKTRLKQWLSWPPVCLPAHGMPAAGVMGEVVTERIRAEVARAAPSTLSGTGLALGQAVSSLLWMPAAQGWVRRAAGVQGGGLGPGGAASSWEGSLWLRGHLSRWPGPSPWNSIHSRVTTSWCLHAVCDVLCAGRAASRSSRRWPLRWGACWAPPTPVLYRLYRRPWRTYRTRSRCCTTYCRSTEGGRAAVLVVRGGTGGTALPGFS